jgi:signal transduction histidine kinase
VKKRPPIPARRVVKELKPLLVILAAFAIAIVALFLVFMIQTDKNSDLLEEEDYLLSLSASVSAHTDSILKETSYVLSSLDHWIAAHQGEDPREAAEFVGYVQDFRSTMQGLIDIRLVTKEGQLCYVPADPRDPFVDVSDRSYFFLQQDPATRGFQICDPVQSRVNGRWFLPVSMPLHPNKAGMDVIVATIDLQVLDGFYSTFLPVNKGAISLLREDGTVLMRTPFNSGYLGAKADMTGQKNRIAWHGKERPSISYMRGIDGFNRIIAYREMMGRNIVVSISSTLHEVLASWRSGIPFIIAGGAILIGLILFLTWRIFLYLAVIDTVRKDLLSTIERLEENRAAKDKLISIVSHDLRGPVGGIKSLLETLLEEADGLSPEELKENLAALSEAANNTYRLLDDLLTWSRSQRGAMVFEPVSMAFLPIAEDCVEDAVAQCAAKGIELKVEAEPGTVIHADENMLRTIMRNLVTNAIKFSLPGGQVLIAATSGAGGTEVSITDEGEGMDVETKAKVFKVGAVKSRPGTAGEKGTGLGLPVVKDFMDRHGGTIRITSVERAGTRFTLFFPAPSSGSGGKPGL